MFYDRIKCSYVGVLFSQAMNPWRKVMKRCGWGPWVYLGFLVFPIASPFLNPVATAWNWLATGACIAGFLPLHFWSFDKVGPPRLLAAVGMTAIGAVGLIFGLNSGASAFLIYAAASIGNLGRPRFAVLGIAILMAVAFGFFLVSQVPLFPDRVWAFAPAFVFIPIVGAITVFEVERAMNNARLNLAQGEVERLAVIAERERIGRDLHDLLGHTLSMITLKSQLARKLTTSDPAAAAREMHEVETISRDSLKQVRQAVGGYRAKGLSAEIAAAERALKWAGIACDVETDVGTLPPPHETALALALREGITNIIRHSGAAIVTGRLASRPGNVTLTLTDNGRGGGVEGNGLAGVRERIEQLGGSFHRRSHDGTTLTVRLPVDEDDSQPEATPQTLSNLESPKPVPATAP